MQLQKLLTFFSKNISILAIFNDQNFNDTLTNDIVSFEQLDPGGCGSKPPSPPLSGRQHSFVEIDREIFSTVILSLSLIQEGQLSVSGERMCTMLVNRLED